MLDSERGGLRWVAHLLLPVLTMMVLGSGRSYRLLCCPTLILSLGRHLMPLVPLLILALLLILGLLLVLPLRDHRGMRLSLLRICLLLLLGRVATTHSTRRRTAFLATVSPAWRRRTDAGILRGWRTSWRRHRLAW